MTELLRLRKHSQRVLQSDVLRSSLDRSHSQALEPSTRTALEPRFGHSFEKVRIYADTEANHLAEDLGARAFTFGNNVFFRDGQYAPNTPEGQHLLAHELTHVVQRDRFGASGNLETSQASDASEIEARTAADSILIGGKASVANAPLTAVSRQEDSPWQSWHDNPIWNTITNNTVSGGVSLFENAWTGINTLPTLTRGLMSAENALGNLFNAPAGVMTGLNGMNAGFAMENALAAPATALPGLLRPVASLGSQSPVAAALGPLGMVSNAMSLHDAFTRPGNFGLENLGDAISSGAGLVSSGVATTGLAGAGLTAAGATGAGGALTGAAAAAGPVGAVLGAGAGGYALGRLLDQGVDWIGDQVSGNADADHSISGEGADLMTRIDRSLSGYSEEPIRNPDGTYRANDSYRHTLGWWLADHLPSWMQ